MNYRSALEEWRAAYLLAALERAGGDVRKAAAAIGVHRSYFYRFTVVVRVRIPRGNGAWQALQ